jgi:hypothetical protein
LERVCTLPTLAPAISLGLRIDEPSASALRMPLLAQIIALVASPDHRVDLITTAK